MIGALRVVVLALIGLWVLGYVAAAFRTVFGENGGATIGFAVMALIGAGLWVVRWRLRVKRPWVWWPVFGAPVAVVRMLWTWRATCEGLGLSVPAKRFNSYGLVNTGAGNGRRGGGLIVRGEPLKLIAPRRAGLRLTRCALVVTVKLHPGQTPADWERAAEAFSHQWRVHRVRAVSKRSGFMTLTGLGFDPLRHPPIPKTIAQVQNEPLSVAEGAEGSPVEPGRVAVTPQALMVSVGVDENGESWVVDLTRRAHHLITGATQSGKSTLTVRLLGELAQRPVGLVGIDAKNGMELAPFAPRLSALATSRAEAAAALDALIGVLYLRTILCREHNARSIWEVSIEERPSPLVVVVDEVAELFLAVDKAGRDEAARCVNALVRLGQLGAALGIHLWVVGQRFGSDLGPGATLLRAQLSGRICHRVADAETATMTLAGLPAESVVEAQRIGADLSGVAVVGDDSGAWFLARSHPLPVAQAAQIARRYTGLTVALPEVTAAIDAVRMDGGGW